MSENKEYPKELPIAEPMGAFILAQEDIQPMMTGRGAFYYYGDVCKMLERRDKLSEVEPKKDGEAKYTEADLKKAYEIGRYSYANEYNFSDVAYAITHPQIK